MANWYGTARSNWFRVKDEPGFRAWVKKWDLYLAEREDNGVKTFALFRPENSDTGGWPSWSEDEDGDEIEFDMAADLPPLLADGEIVIKMECGAEKLRYITGSAEAIHADGRSCFILLSDIYERAAKEFGVPIESINEAAY